MTATGEGITLGTFLRHYPPQIVEDVWQRFVNRRLNDVLEAANELIFDNSSRFILFSDCHRGNNGPVDDFAKNKELFLKTLTYYYHQGFSYIEVGDGDDLWQNRRFGDVWRAHRCVFDLLHKFNNQNRLHLIIGNHEIQGSRYRPVEKDGIVAQEGLILKHRHTGQKIFVVHGHQADFTSDRLHVFSRFVTRYIWQNLRRLGFGNGYSGQKKEGTFEQRFMAWVESQPRKIEQRLMA